MYPTTLHNQSLVLNIKAGIGDMIHLLPAIDSLFTDGIEHISLFTRPDAIGIYQGFERVSEYNRDALDILRQECDKPRTSLVDISGHLHTLDMHRSYKYAYCIYNILGVPLKKKLILPKLKLTDAEIAWGQRIKRTEQPSYFFQIHSFRANKSLPIGNILPVMRYLLESGNAVFYTADQPLLYRHKNLRHLHHYTIRQLMCILANMDVAVVPDSGIGHISTALRTRTIMLFGPTDPNLYAYDLPTSEVYRSPDYNMQSFAPDMMREMLIQPLSYRYKLAPMTNDPILYSPESYPMIRKDSTRIAFIVPYMFIGGGETHLWYLLEQWSKIYKDMVVILAKNNPDYGDPIMIERIKKHARLLYNYELTGDDHINWIKSELIKFNPDVIFHHGDILTEPIFKGLIPKPVIIQIIHTVDERWGVGVARKVAHFNDIIIPVGKHIEKKYWNQLPCIRWNTILNGVAVPTRTFTYNRNHSGFIVGMMSRLVGGKGLEQAIEAIRRLPSDIKLRIGGWGEDEKYKAMALDLGDKVEFVGKVENTYDFLTDVDCFLLPSISEGNSMTILEAAMVKKPLIVTPVGSVPELFRDGESAVFVEYNPVSIKDGITKLYNDPQFANLIAKKAYDIVNEKASSLLMSRQYAFLIKEEMKKRISPKSIAIVRLEGAGDVIFTIPMLKFLRHRYPDAQIWYYTKPSIACLVPRNLVNNVVEVSQDPAVVNFNKEHPTTYEGYIPFDILIRASHLCLWDTNPPNVYNWYLSLVNAPPGDRKVDLDIHLVEKFPAKIESPILHRHSSMASRDWGTDSDWKAIEQACGGDVIYLDDVAKELTLLESAKLISQAPFFVGIDSVGLHLAHAVGTRAVGIYPSSNPDICGYPENINIEGIKCEGRHCKVNITHPCICKEEFKCLDTITVEQIVSAIEKIKR